MAFTFNFDVFSDKDNLSENAEGVVQSLEKDQSLLFCQASRYTAQNEQAKVTDKEKKSLERDEEKTLEDSRLRDQSYETSASVKVKEAQEHKYTLDHLSEIENLITETVTLGALPPLIYLNESVIVQTASEQEDAENILFQTAAKNSDLITGVYEGGLKIWEGTYDLLEYIDNEGVCFSGKRMLDLGCGAGLLGILALKRGASMVHFQDYNSTVIEQLTIPNMFLNCEEESDEDKEKKDGSPVYKQKKVMDASYDSLKNRCRFFSGDWTSFLSLIQSGGPMLKYDIIFTSETIYNTEYYPSLHDVFHSLLDKNGVIYLATKSHYFGVGGGLYLFENFVKEKAVFQIKCLKDLDQGLKRHIVSLKHKKSSA